MNNWLLTPKQMHEIVLRDASSEAIAKAQVRHILERLNEECIEPEHYKNVATPIGWRKRHRCFQCMAEFEKELIGEK
jgi:CTP:molybdopterin cytidylyltransferase MocA